MHVQCHSQHSKLVRYNIQSTDVLTDMRINVCEEHNKEKVIWYKERFLSDTEVVDHLVHNSTSTIQWTIHRPKRGWYLRLHSPSFPANFFIQLQPVPARSIYYTEGALGFKSRTSIPRCMNLSTGPSAVPPQLDSARESTSSVHSYPPTPPAVPAVQIHPPSPRTINKHLSMASSSSSSSSTASSPPPSSRHPSHRPPSQITQFVLTPHSFQPQPVPPNSSLLDKALSYLKTHRPSHSNSFTLSRIPDGLGLTSTMAEAIGASTVGHGETVNSSILGATSTVALVQPPPAVPISLVNTHIPPAAAKSSTTPIPLMIFHDQTPLFTVRTLSGMLEIDQGEEQDLGVDTSFWVAVGLTYLDFLEERESYLAALSD
jgi:hypothetical protein